MTKSPNLYYWILGIGFVLDLAAVWTTLPSLRAAYRFNPTVGVLATFALILICYFWVNGTKDVVYTAFYHYGIKQKGISLPPIGLSLRKWTAQFNPWMRDLWMRPMATGPRVVMVYCTCNDFNAYSLETSMRQDYRNYYVVILDDSSKPEYMQQVYEFAAKHRIRVIRREGNAGFKGGNLNHGLDLLQDWDYFVILDSDEVTPRNFISRTLDYFAEDSTVGIVQANHRATRNRNVFMKRFAIGVDSHWDTYQTVKERYGFTSLLGHGAISSRAAYEAAGGFPHVVSEDVCYSIEARNAGFLTVFAPDVICEEEFPVNYGAFTKRHGKWTQGNMEFIRLYTGAIFRSKMRWFEKLDLILFTYSLPLTAVFAVFVLINVVVFPAFGFTFTLPLWMLAPTILFLVAPMLNDIWTYFRVIPTRELLTYLVQSTLLFGSMFFISLQASVKALTGKPMFVVTPKEDQIVTLRDAFKIARVPLIFGSVLALVTILFTHSLLPVFFLVLPAIMAVYMAVIHQPTPGQRSRAAARVEKEKELVDSSL